MQEHCFESARDISNGLRKDGYLPIGEMKRHAHKLTSIVVAYIPVRIIIDITSIATLCANHELITRIYSLQLIPNVELQQRVELSRQVCEVVNVLNQSLKPVFNLASDCISACRRLPSRIYFPIGPHLSQV